MSSLVGGLFGDNEQSVSQQRLPPLNINTITSGGSRLNSNRRGETQRTSVNLPSIIDDERGQVRSGFQSLLDRVQGGNSAFVQAAVNPLIERLTGIPGQLSRNLGRRGVFGSIADQSVRNAEIDVARAISDGTLNAERQGIGIEGSVLTNLRGLTQDKLNQELSALGLSQNTINSIIASQLPTGQTSTSNNSGSGIGNLLFGVGSILG